MNDYERLDDAKRRFLAAKKEIDELRQAIAVATCPIKIEDRISVEEDGKEYDGVVDDIGPALTNREIIEPIVGAPTGWVVSGKKIKKTDGEISTWGFGFSSFHSTFEGGKWVVKNPTLEESLGLARDEDL
jgi:hypothetical protein